MKLTVLPLPIYIFPGPLTGLSSVKVVIFHLSSCSKIELHARITTALNKLVASSMETTCIGCFQDPSSVIIALEHYSSGPLQLYNMYFPELRGYEVVCCMLCLSHFFVGILQSLDPENTTCFGGKFGRFITKYMLGYEMMIIASFKNLLPAIQGAVFTLCILYELFFLN